MTAEARRTLALIRECIKTDRYAVTRHFSGRMQERALFWPDVQAVIHDPTEICSEGMDEYDRPKWRIRGDAADTGEITIVCAIEFVKSRMDEAEESETEFITLY